MLLPLAVALLLCSDAAAAKFHKIDSTTVEGELQSVDAKGVVTVKSEKGATVQIPSDELIRVEFAGSDREADEPLDGVVLHLPGGDRVFGSPKTCSQTSIELESGALGKLKMPLERLLAIEFRRAGEQPKNAEKMRAEMLSNETKNDVSFSANGDQMPGILVGFDGETMTFKTSLGEMPLKSERLFGLSFAARARAVPPPSLLAVVQCADGSVVTGRLIESKGAAVRLALLAGPEVEVPAGSILELGFKQGRLVYLSELEPSSEKATPFFGGDHVWPAQRNRSYDRRPIRLAGQTYRKGLGMFSGMTLTYDLGGQFQRFASLVGIDDGDVNYQGDVTVKVLADGKEVFKKEGVTRKTGPANIDLPMKGVKKLQLAVEFGGNMHFGDLTDWADAHLIR